MNNKGKAQEITIGGAIILIVLGIIFLSQSGSDSTGIIGWMGIVFLIVGIIGIIALLIKLFK